MSYMLIVTGNQLCFDQFKGVPMHFIDVHNFINTTRLEKALSTNTRIYSDLIGDFYLNGKYRDIYIVSNVKGIVLSFYPMDFANDLRFTMEGLTGFGKVNVKKALCYIGYKKNPALKGMKKKKFP